MAWSWNPNGKDKVENHLYGEEFESDSSRKDQFKYFDKLCSAIHSYNFIIGLLTENRWIATKEVHFADRKTKGSLLID